jgi:hypothetical protein
MANEDREALTEYSDDGVDLTLIRWMLSLTPAERLQPVTFFRRYTHCTKEASSSSLRVGLPPF